MSMLGLKDLAAIAAEHTVDLEAEVRPVSYTHLTLPTKA